LDLYETEGSGWTVLDIQKVTEQILPFRPTIKRGKDIPPLGGAYIPLPSHLLVNIRTHIDRCFMLCIVAHFYRHQISLPELPGVSFERLD